MKKRDDIKVTVYEAPMEGFMIEIANDGNEYGAWLYHEKYGVKEFMFGVDASDEDLESFADLVEANLEDGKYYVGYAFDHMDEDDRTEAIYNLIYVGMVFGDADSDWEITKIDGYYVWLREIHTGEEDEMPLDMVEDAIAEHIKGRQ